MFIYIAGLEKVIILLNKHLAALVRPNCLESKILHVLEDMFLSYACKGYLCLTSNYNTFVRSVTDRDLGEVVAYSILTNRCISI